MAAMVYRILKDNPRYRWLSIATSNSQRVSIWSSLRQLFPRAYACTCGHINNNLNIIHVIYACNCFNKAKITHLYEYYEWTHTDIYIYICVCTYAYMHIYIIYYSMRYIIYILHMQPTINHHPISLSPCRPSPALGISEVLDAAVEELTKAVPRATATNMGIYNG